MSTATSASDRYDEARALLAAFDGTPNVIKDDFNPHTLADALRAVVEPAAVNESVDEWVEREINAERLEVAFRVAGDKDGMQFLRQVLAHAVQAGIQLGWNSWEPENAPGLVEEARYDRIEGAIRLAFEGEGEAWSDKLSGDRLAAVARRAIEEGGL
ncbi:MAG: hypothetical protein K0Q52_168 [Microbacterium sp.]|nr:hypothetical protein [Microbacterium sp.]